MSPDHDLYTQLPPIGDRGSLEHHVDRKARESPQNQKRRVSVSGPFYLDPGLSFDSSFTGSVIHHGTIQGARRYKSTRELKRNPGSNRQDNSAADQARSRHSIASISPSVNIGADPGPITMGMANTVLLPSPGNHRRNRNNGHHAGHSGQFAGLRDNDDGGSLQGTSTDEDGQAPLIATQPRPANTLYQHDNIQFGYGLSSSPIPDDDASVFSTVDGEFVRSGLAAAPREQRARPVAPPTTPVQTQIFTSNIQQTPGSPLDGVSYPVMTPGSHNLPIIEPGDRSGLSPEKADNMSPYKSPEKNVASGFSPEKDESPEKQAGSTFLPHNSPAENIACGLFPDRVESPARAAWSRVPFDVRSSPFNQMQGSRMLGPMSLSISRQRAHVGHGASNSGSIPSSPGLVEVGALERQVSGQVQRHVSTFSSPQHAPPPRRSSSALSPRCLRIPPGFGGGVQRAQSQMRGMVRSPSKAASLFKEGVASVRRQLGISESGAIETSALRDVDENADPRRSEGRERKKLTKRIPTVSKPSNNLKNDERDADDNVFVTNGAPVDAGVALGGLGSGGVIPQSFGVARNYNLAEIAPSGSDHRVHSQRDPFVSKFSTSVANSAALSQTAVDVGPQNVSATSQLSRATVSGGVHAGNSSRDFEPADGRDEADAGPISPCTAALNGLAAFGERLESGQAFISKEKKEKATAVKSEGHATEEGKRKQEAVEKTEERTAEEAKIRDALKLASATAAPEANVTSQDVPRTPENTRLVSAAARYPRRRSSLKQLRPRPLLEDSPSLTIFGGVVGRANRHYHTNTPRSHADRARQEVHVQDQAQDHIHPPPRGASHSHPSPPVIGRARMVDIPAGSLRLHNRVPHGHPDSTPAGSPRPEGFDDLYDVTPPGTPRRRARQSALVPASVHGSPTRGANITAAGVQIRDASNAANLFRAAPRLSPSAAPRAPQSSPVLPVPGSWPKERREASEETIREGEEGEEGVVEREDHVFSSPAPGDYSLMYMM